jgi:hypothetical protein
MLFTLLLTLTTGYLSSQQAYCQTSILSPQEILYAVPTPGLSRIPELRTDMTLEAFIGYVYLDSLSRTIGIETAVASPDNMTIHDLKAISRYIYGMGDYNPILLLRHFTSTLDSSFPNERYASYPANTYYNILRVIDERRNEFGKDNALLIISSYILHVRATATITGMDTSFGSPTPHTTIACDIIETFKGKVSPNNNCKPPALINGKEENTLSSPGCVVYGQPYNEHQPNRAYIPQTGDEYIVCLFLLPSFEHGARLQPFNINEGVFRIVGDKVEDPNNVWGLGTKPSLADFRKNLLDKISEVKNWKW